MDVDVSYSKVYAFTMKYLQLQYSKSNHNPPANIGSPTFGELSRMINPLYSRDLTIEWNKIGGSICSYHINVAHQTGIRNGAPDRGEWGEMRQGRGSQPTPPPPISLPVFSQAPALLLPPLVSRYCPLFGGGGWPNPYSAIPHVIYRKHASWFNLFRRLARNHPPALPCY